jgi:hypothetical protein
VIVLVIPRFGSLLVAGWLGGIVTSLIIVGGYGDIVLRDLALLVVALAVSRLAWAQPTGHPDDHTKHVGRGTASSVGGGASPASNGADRDRATHRVTA